MTEFVDYFLASAIEIFSRVFQFTDYTIRRWGTLGLAINILTFIVFAFALREIAHWFVALASRVLNVKWHHYAGPNERRGYRETKKKKNLHTKAEKDFRNFTRKPKPARRMSPVRGYYTVLLRSVDYDRLQWVRNQYGSPQPEGIAHEYALAVERIAPLIMLDAQWQAMGRQMIAANVSDQHWKSYVSTMLDYSSGIILLPGTGEGLSWEMNYVSQNELLKKKTALIIPRKSRSQRCREADFYDQALSATKKHFHISPPSGGAFVFEGSDKLKRVYGHGYRSTPQALAKAIERRIQKNKSLAKCLESI